MDSRNLIASLERFGQFLPQVVRDVPVYDARWKPDDGAWSILEILCHLGDEEERDFRPRIAAIWEGREWERINPEGWAVEQHYNHRDLAESAARFADARTQSIEWLHSLDDPDWHSYTTHPKYGVFKAGDLLASWAAHDALHLRQIAKRMHQLASRDAGEFSVRYAGEWKA